MSLGFCPPWGSSPCIDCLGSRLLEVVSDFSTTVDPHGVPDLAPAALRAAGHGSQTDDGLFIPLFKKNSGLLGPGPVLTEQPVSDPRQVWPVPWSQPRRAAQRACASAGSHTGRGPHLSACSLPSALQALKKDESVPWTGMLAIVHSYVTHKTGREWEGTPTPFSQPTSRPLGSPGPEGGCSGQSSAKRAPGTGPVSRAGTIEDGLLVPMHPVGPLAPAGRGLRHRPWPPTADLPRAWPGLFLVKEEEKQKLLQRGSELQTEHQQLEERDRRLASAVKVRARGPGLSGRRGCPRTTRAGSKGHGVVTEVPTEGRLANITQ